RGLALPNDGIGSDFFAHCTPDQASGVAAVIGGRCDVFTAVASCGAPDTSAPMLTLALPLSTARPRRVAVLRIELAALLPAELAGRPLRASHDPTALPSDTRAAIVEAVEQAIARMLQGGPLGRPDAVDETAAHAVGEAPDVTAGLPRRQRQVLALLGEGMSNAQIAGALGISMNTAKLHVSAVLRRLGLGNRMQAVALGARLSHDRGELVPAFGAE
ncbi:helix-turn-helix transcriptional regulator, partial [Rhodoplanes roseus]